MSTPYDRISEKMHYCKKQMKDALEHLEKNEFQQAELAISAQAGLKGASGALEEIKVLYDHVELYGNALKQVFNALRKMDVAVIHKGVSLEALDSAKKEVKKEMEALHERADDLD